MTTLLSREKLDESEGRILDTNPSNQNITDISIDEMEENAYLSTRLQGLSNKLDSHQQNTCKVQESLKSMPSQDIEAKMNQSFEWAYYLGIQEQREVERANKLNILGT